MINNSNHKNILLHFNFIKDKNVLGLFLSMGLTYFFLSLVNIFVPIYLIKEIGFSFDVAMYYLIILSLSILLSFFIVMKIVSLIGLNKTLILSVPIRLIFILLLSGLKYYAIPLTLIAFLGGLGSSLFWFPYHKRFTESTNHEKRGSELGVRFSVAGMFVVAGPLLGGFLVSFYGFTVLYIFAAIILILSIVPLLLLEDEFFGDGFKLIKILKGRTYKEILAYFAEGYRQGANLLWPIFIFMVLGSYVTLGGIYSIIALFESVYLLFVGYIADIFNRETLFKLGSLVDSFTWFFRVFFISLTSIFSFTILSSLAISTWYLPFASKYYDKFGEPEGVNQIIFRELGLSLGKISVFLIAIMLGLKFSLLSCGAVMLLIWLY